MTSNRSMPPGIIIPELAYADVRTAVDWQCKTSGFRERLRIGDHRAQLVLDGTAVIVTQGADTPSPPRGGHRWTFSQSIADVAHPIGAALGSTSLKQDAR